MGEDVFGFGSALDNPPANVAPVQRALDKCMPPVPQPHTTQLDTEQRECAGGNTATTAKDGTASTVPCESTTARPQAAQVPSGPLDLDDMDDDDPFGFGGG